MNSIIEAQIELKEQIDLEFEKCRNSPYYFFLNYWIINNKLIETSTSINEDVFNYYVNKDINTIGRGVYINKIRETLSF